MGAALLSLSSFLAFGNLKSNFTRTILVRKAVHSCQPLNVFAVAGGLFTSRYTSLDDQVEPGSRFDTSGAQGQVRAAITIPVEMLNTFSFPSQNFRKRYAKQV
jgi:hypothetical protein